MSIHFYLVRHGQTKLNRRMRVQGTTDSDLTKKGVLMAKRLGHELANIKFAGVYTSDLQRTKTTAEYIIKNNKQYYPPVYCEPALREFSFGELESQSNFRVVLNACKKIGLKSLMNIILKKDHVREVTEMFELLEPNQLEAFDHMVQRMKRALEVIASQYPDDSNILIVTHGLILSCFIESLNGNVPLFLLDNSRASLVDYEEGKFTVKYVNQVKVN